MITNPPFGVSWKSEEDFIKNEAKDPMEGLGLEHQEHQMVPYYFYRHLISKMEPKGSRIGIVFNGSPLFTGDAGSGESEIRKWIIENDLLETVIMLPDKLFFNTHIATYIWILDNKKNKNRKNKIQMINAKDHCGFMKKKLGEKNKEISDYQIAELLKIYLKFENNDLSKICDNSEFGYTKIIIDKPLTDKDGTKIKDKKGNIIMDKKLKDHERIPFKYPIETYLNNEVKPHIGDFIYDKNQNKIGYELSLTKEFYEHTNFKNIEKIKEDITKINQELEKIEKKL